jgi:hypothetical protein
MISCAAKGENKGVNRSWFNRIDNAKRKTIVDKTQGRKLKTEMGKPPGLISCTPEGKALLAMRVVPIVISHDRGNEDGIVITTNGTYQQIHYYPWHVRLAVPAPLMASVVLLLLQTPVKSHEWGKDRIVITTNGIYPVICDTHIPLWLRP